MTDGTTTAAFDYNADGLRIRKTIGSTVTEYTLHGKNIVHLTRGSANLHFFYDAQNKPSVVDYNGTKYAYIHNLQGDIVSILNASGTEVVRYTYDAWGRQLSKTGSMASTLGAYNPFRYRGYAYDEETGLYYLRSRYYNPVWLRFVNADSTMSVKNVFTYCRNTVINRADSDGTFDFPVSLVEMTILHETVVRLVTVQVGGQRERHFTQIPGAGPHGGIGFPDVIVRDRYAWEIKPASSYGKRTGPQQIGRYTNGTGHLPGYPLPIQPFPYVLGGNPGVVTIQNGSAVTGDAGVVYYDFSSQQNTESNQVPSIAVQPAPVQAQKSVLGAVLTAILFVVTIVSPIPGDEILALSLFAF
jgi:RHS repeat-associated protein